jgi:hypothetical protein
MTTADFRSKMMAAYMMRDHHEEWWIVWIYVHAPIRWEVGGELWEVIREALQGI